MEIKLSDLEELNPTYWFVDFDCTLVKSLEPMVAELNKAYNSNVTPADIKSWNFREVQEDISDDFIEYLFSTEKFFDTLEFYDGAKEFLDKYRKNVIIVTKGLNDNLNRKRKWLDKQGFSDVKMIGLDLKTSKSFVNMNIRENDFSIFIDDSTYNLIDSNAKLKVQFREFGETEWNKNWEGYILKKWI